MLPQFEYGDSVRLIRSVRNDGTYPGMEVGEFMVKRGSVGYVQNVGTYLQDQVIYSVHFLESNMVVGCRAEELVPESMNYVMSKFEFRDKVTPTRVLAVNGEIIASPGDVAEVIKTIRDEKEDGEVDIQYHVRFPGRTLQVQEALLEEAVLEDESGDKSTEGNAKDSAEENETPEANE